jgi:hypothetical protein
MWKYVKAAFSLMIPLPVVGPLPLNWVALACGAILGLAYPPLWLAVGGLELVYLYWIGSNPRFRAVVDGIEMQTANKQARQSRDEIVATLTAAQRSRLEATEAKFNKVLAEYRRGGSTFAHSNAEALSRLMTAYVKLLLAERQLNDFIAGVEGERLNQKIDRLTREIGSGDLAGPTVNAKEKTLEITRKRLEQHGERKQQLVQIHSDLERIEAQLDLAVESAAAPVEISSSIDLLSDIITDGPDPFGAQHEDQVLYGTEMER